MTAPVAPSCAPGKVGYCAARSPAAAELDLVRQLRAADVFSDVPENAEPVSIEWRGEGFTQFTVTFRHFDPETSQPVLTEKNVYLGIKYQEPEPDPKSTIRVHCDVLGATEQNTFLLDLKTPTLSAIPELASIVTEARTARERFLVNATQGFGFTAGVVGSNKTAGGRFGLELAFSPNVAIGVRLGAAASTDKGAMRPRADAAVLARLSGSTLYSGTGVVATAGVDGKAPSGSVGYFFAVTPEMKRASNGAIRVVPEVRLTAPQKDGTPAATEVGVAAELVYF